MWNQIVIEIRTEKIITMEVRAALAHLDQEKT